ncbi:MAG: FMN-binding protein [Acholeplasmataceae bacterium]|nr:FMN-binding protein [Acholeplasmataceae bacterium]
MKKRHIILIVAILVIIAVVITVVLMVQRSERNIEEMMKITLTDPDLMELEDGTYEGSYGSIPIAVKVTVTIEEHRITNITIVEHVHGQGEQGEIIISQVIFNQSIEIDLIAGATYSSKAILLAIDDALSPDA